MDENEEAAFDRSAATGNEVWILTKVIDADSDPDWSTRLVLVTTPEQVRENGIPAGWQLLRGKEALRFLQASAAEEFRYQREQQTRRDAGGAN